MDGLARWAPLLGLAMLAASTGARLLGLRRAGIDALQLDTDDGAHAFLGRMLKAAAVATTAYVVGRALWPGLDGWVGPIGVPPGWMVLAGAALAVGGAALTGAGQIGMGTSWRIGIDRATATGLVTTGLFSRSRNPIYAGMAAYAVGLFALAPTAPSLALVAAAVVGMGVQIRLEEEHMRRLHGSAFDAYCARVRRWL